MNKYNSQEYLDGIGFLDNFITEKQEAGEKVSSHAVKMWNELERIGLSPADRIRALRECYRLREDK